VSTTHQARGSAAGLPRILCVDDEPAVLESLSDTLHRYFDVWTATSGAAGLDQLRAEPLEFAVVMSDMRMPVMPGHVFLHEACKLAPDATRMLLTGYADVDAAISAVNDGQLFRFLTKPCSPTDLLASCQAALAQHRLRTAEKVLLEQTLKGSLKALSDVLALANPAAFGRSASVRRHAQRLAAALDAGTTWEVEVAAMLAQLGAITLPPATAEKLYSGANLIPREQEMVARVPELTRQILANIPRLEGVLAILDNYPCPYGAMGAGRSLPIGARIVRIAIDYDALEARGYTSDVALSTLRGRAKAYDPDLLALLERIVGTDTRAVRVTEIPLLSLRAGMMLVDDVRSAAGSLLIARGHVATEQLVTRLWNLGEGNVREPLLVAEAPPAVSELAAPR
jgi:response regulator RpfG family c-di-GMP phosphodiesterase